MTSPIDPSRSVPVERRQQDRRERQRRQAQAEAGAPAEDADAANLPSVAGPQTADPKGPHGSAAALAAQLLGQGGQKRGLKGGPPVLTGARAAYLEAEWSGPNDRRKPAGRITRTKI